MDIPTTPPADHATLFGRERGHLLDLLRGLGAEDWGPELVRVFLRTRAIIGSPQ